MKATFIGADGSMGLRHGQIYHLEVKIDLKSETVMVEGYHNPRDLFSDIPIRGFACPYDNMNGFLKNWEPVCFGKK